MVRTTPPGRGDGNFQGSSDACSPPTFATRLFPRWWIANGLPGHTPVPEYIRLIAAGPYADAYMVNSQFNVFPGSWDGLPPAQRPACRRGGWRPSRWQSAGSSVSRRTTRATSPPPAPPATQRTAIASAWGGEGPATLTVAGDLAPAGYEVVVFDGFACGGGIIRSQILKFRLPEEVIDEEVGYIERLGVETRYRPGLRA